MAALYCLAQFCSLRSKSAARKLTNSETAQPPSFTLFHDRRNLPNNFTGSSTAVIKLQSILQPEAFVAWLVVLFTFRGCTQDAKGEYAERDRNMAQGKNSLKWFSCI